jgi:hypothetical protein
MPPLFLITLCIGCPYHPLSYWAIPLSSLHPNEIFIRNIFLPFLYSRTCLLFSSVAIILRLNPRTLSCIHLFPPSWAATLPQPSFSIPSPHLYLHHFFISACDPPRMTAASRETSHYAQLTSLIAATLRCVFPPSRQFLFPITTSWQRFGGKLRTSHLRGKNRHRNSVKGTTWMSEVSGPGEWISLEMRSVFEGHAVA